MKQFIESEIEATELAANYFETTFEIKRQQIDFGFYACTRFLWAITATGGGVAINFAFYLAYYLLLIAAIAFDTVTNAIFVLFWALYRIIRYMLTNSTNVIFRFFISPILFVLGLGTVFFLIYKLFTTKWASINLVAEKFLEYIF